MFRFLVFVCALVQGVAAWGADDATQWLAKMRTASRTLNYDGVFVYVYGGKVEAMRVVHQTKNGLMKERIYALNGAPREIIRDAVKVWCYVPEKKMGVHEYRQVSKQSFPRILPSDIEDLRTSYSLSLGHKERIADRVSQIIMIKPKDELRYGYALWADDETGLILKAALLDTDGKPIEQYMFANVSVGGEIPDRELEPMTPKKDLAWFGGDSVREDADSTSESGGKSQWRIGLVPKGFTLSRSIKRMSPMRKRMVEHFVYSDGLAAVSIFIEKIDDDDNSPIIGTNRMGAIHAYGKVVDGHQITVVGEVPSSTVSMIGESVSRSTD